jgi:hypothetical protein
MATGFCKSDSAFYASAHAIPAEFFNGYTIAF